MNWYTLVCVAQTQVMRADVLKLRARLAAAEARWGTSDEMKQDLAERLAQAEEMLRRERASHKDAGEGGAHHSWRACIAMREGGVVPVHANALDVPMVPRSSAMVISENLDIFSFFCSHREGVSGHGRQAACHPDVLVYASTGQCDHDAAAADSAPRTPIFSSQCIPLLGHHSVHAHVAV